MAPPDVHTQPCSASSSSLDRLLSAGRWGEAVRAARRKLASDPRDGAAWAGLARALLRGLQEPEAAYTAFGRALEALEPEERERQCRTGLGQELASQQLECLSAVVRAESNAVCARWQRSGLGLAPGKAPPAPPGPAADGAHGSVTRDSAARSVSGRDPAGSTEAPEAPAPRVFALSDLHVDAAAAGLGPRGLTTHGSRGASADGGGRLGGSGTHMELLRRISATRFQRDVLLVAGDVADTLPPAVEALRLLKARFARVFYVPGNHCLWLRPGLEAGADGAATSASTPTSVPSASACASAFPDSLSKLWALLAACDDLGVETVAAEVAPGLAVVPLLSWYSATFDTHDPRPGRYRFDRWCRWPVSELDVWQVMLRLNDATLAHVDRWHRGRQGGEQREQEQEQSREGERMRPRITPAAPLRPAAALQSGVRGGGAAGGGGGGGEVVITMSHFLPHPALPFPRAQPEMAKAVGCRELLLLLDRLRSAVHVYGHTHMPYDAKLAEPAAEPPRPSGSAPARTECVRGDRRYVHWPLQGQGRTRAVLRCIWDGQRLCCEDVDSGE